MKPPPSPPCAPTPPSSSSSTTASSPPTPSSSAPSSPPPSESPSAPPTTTPAPTSTPVAPYDTYYTSSPQQWAVLQSGGFGAGIAGGPAHGPWDTTMGAGVRIAILDSGVDRNHPDIAPNLAFNLSEIDQSPLTGLPSPCDDGTPQDQQGHGTWVASLAAAAIGPGTGLLIGVAPAATILNIKVLERLPDPSSTAPGVATQCATGQAGGLLSWVIQGIEDAIAQHADVINLSLGTLVDLDTGEGAGLLATFDRVTYAASQAGAVVIASAGNDGVNLANPRYIEPPRPVPQRPRRRRLHQPCLCRRPLFQAPPAPPAPSPSPTTPTSARPLTPSPRPAAAIPTAPPSIPTQPSADGFAAPAPTAFPTPPTARPPTAPTASAASISATPPMFRPWAPAPRRPRRRGRRPASRRLPHLVPRPDRRRLALLRHPRLHPPLRSPAQHPRRPPITTVLS